jgi:hypothetical protein
MSPSSGLTYLVGPSSRREQNPPTAQPNRQLFTYCLPGYTASKQYLLLSLNSDHEGNFEEHELLGLYIYIYIYIYIYYRCRQYTTQYITTCFVRLYEVGNYLESTHV